MPQTSSFFELAALLIPVLLLSGVATSRLKPEVILHPQKGDFLRFTAVLVGFLFIPMTGEAIALSAVMGGGLGVSRFETWVVAATVAFGIVAVSTSLIWPWVRRVWIFSGPRARVAFVVMNLLLVGFLGRLLATGVDLQRTLAVNTKLEAVVQNRESEEQVHNLLMDQIAARESLLDARLRVGDITKKHYLRESEKLMRQRSKAIVSRTTTVTTQQQDDLERLLTELLDQTG